MVCACAFHELAHTPAAVSVDTAEAASPHKSFLNWTSTNEPDREVLETAFQMKLHNPEHLKNIIQIWPSIVCRASLLTIKILRLVQQTSDDPPGFLVLCHFFYPLVKKEKLYCFFFFFFFTAAISPIN